MLRLALILVFSFSIASVASASAEPTGDPQRGEDLYGRCLGCHAQGYDRTGPRHCGLMGRKAGAVEGFHYSKALRNSGIIWDAESLDRFLEAPRRAVPGTTMAYAGISDQKERDDLIAYIATLTPENPVCQ